LRAVWQKFGIHQLAGIYSIVFGYIYSSEVTWLELWTISTDVKRFCVLEQRKFNYIGKESNYFH